MKRRTVFFVVAHHDDWPLFAGSEAFEFLREPDCRIVVIVTTAGDAGDARSHWQSRLSGGVQALVRGLSAFNPYELERIEAPDLPCSYKVAYDAIIVSDKPVLRVQVFENDALRAGMYALHLPDGGAGDGFAPSFQSLARLYDGKPATTLWPAQGATYGSWAEFEDVLDALVEVERSGADDRVYAADINENENPGDHSDHRFTSMGLARVRERQDAPLFRWVSTYSIASRLENLEGASADAQRALIHAYGGGYMTAISGVCKQWRTGWEREYESFKNRQYIADEGHHERS